MPTQVHHTYHAHGSQQQRGPQHNSIIISKGLQLLRVGLQLQGRVSGFAWVHSPEGLSSPVDIPFGLSILLLNILVLELCLCSMIAAGLWKRKQSRSCQGELPGARTGNCGACFAKHLLACQCLCDPARDLRFWSDCPCADLATLKERQGYDPDCTCLLLL